MSKNLIVFVLMVLFSSCTTHTDTENNSEIESKKMNTLESKAKQTSMKVIDTDFSKGRLTNEQEITLWDVQKMHGHLCDGLVVGFLGLREGLNQLYPDSIIDRTNTRIVAKSSPCIGDIALYLTGGRYQFNSFYVDNEINGMYIVQRIDNKQTVIVSMKEGIKPDEIDILGAKAVKNELDACELDTLKIMEDDFSRNLFNSPPSKIFDIRQIEGFEWKPTLSNEFTKTDILNKNAENCESISPL